MPVDVPEWGGAVYVRVMSGRERDQFEIATMPTTGGTLENLRARLVALCACDAEGVRLFTDADAGALGDLEGAALDRVFAVARRVNKLTAEDIEAEKKT